MLKEITEQTRNNTRENLNKVLNELRELKPKQLTAKYADQLRKDYENASNPVQMLKIVVHIAGTINLLKKIQNETGKINLTLDSQNEYRHLFTSITLMKNPNMTIEEIDNFIDISLLTCPDQEEMDNAINEMRAALNKERAMLSAPSMVN